MVSPNLSAFARRLGSIRFLRFCVVGTCGFITDAGVLSLILYVIGEHPYIGRLCSLPVAMTVTWLLNRRFTFQQAGHPTFKEWLKYISVNAVGASINFLVYTCGIWILPVTDLKLKALLALVIASLCALIFNFLGMKYAVFTQKQ